MEELVDLVDRTVIFDVYGWLTPSNDPKRPHAHTARRGEVIHISQAEADRGEELGALGDAEDLAHIEAAGGVSADGIPGEPVTSSVSDEQLGGYNVDDMVVHLGQYPNDVDRVVALEQGRDKPRKGVLDAADKVKAAYEQAIADQVSALEAGSDFEQRAFEQSTGRASAAPQIP